MNHEGTTKALMNMPPYRTARHKAKPLKLKK